MCCQEPVNSFLAHRNIYWRALPEGLDALSSSVVICCKGENSSKHPSSLLIALHRFTCCNEEYYVAVERLCRHGCELAADQAKLAHCSAVCSGAVCCYVTRVLPEDCRI